MPESLESIVKMPSLGYSLLLMPVGASPAGKGTGLVEAN